MFVETSGTVWSSWRMTVRPFDIVKSVYGSSSFGGAAARACANAGGAEASPTARTAAENVANFIRGDSTAIAPSGLLPGAPAGLFRGTSLGAGDSGVSPRDEDVGEGLRQ